MSLTFEQSSQPLVTSVFLDSHSPHGALTQALLELSQCDAIYTGDVDAATAVVTYSVVKNLGTTSCQVWLYTDNRSRFTQVARYGAVASEPLSQEIIIAHHADYFERLAQRDWLVINTGSPLTGEPIHNRVSPPYLWSQGLWNQAQTITALIEIPIYHHQEIVGILCCAQHQTPRVWQAAEKSFMVTAACLIALTISHGHNRRVTQTLKKQKRQLTLEMIERQQAEKAWQESQCFIQGILDASTNILYVNDFASGTNYYVNGYMKNILGYSPDEIEQLGAQFLEYLAHPDTIKTIHQARQRLMQSQSGDIVESEYQLRHKQGGWHWLLCRETIFQRHQDGTPLQLLGTGTDITAHRKNTEALQQQNQALTALAKVDALTQIANRRAFDEFLRNALVSHTYTPLTLILCDIDYFKLYNDTYGHPAGDECLRRVAQALKKAVKRQADFVARYGGEEFAVVLPNTTLEGATYVAQAIQAHVCNLQIEHRLSAISTHLTMSMGIATMASTANCSLQELIAIADQGLYQAKSDGRAQFSIGRYGDHRQ